MADSTSPLPPLASVPPHDPVQRSNRQNQFVQSIPPILHGLISLGILVLIYYGIFWGSGGFLSSVANKEIGRGFITFLIAITTVGVALGLAAFTIFGKDGEAEAKRFDQGKQILSTFIGILGTIIGFYYGSTSESRVTGPVRQDPTQQEFAVVAPRMSKTQVAKGDTLTISSFLNGGKAPFTYSISFDNTIKTKEGTSADGLIKVEVSIPDDAPADKDISFQIQAKDSDGKQAVAKESSQKFTVKNK